MRLQATIAVIAAPLLLAACTFHATTPQANETLNAEAEAVYADLLAGRDDALIGRLTSETRPEEARAQFPMMRKLVKLTTAPKPTVVATQSTRSTEGGFYVVRQNYDYPDRTVHTETVFRNEGEGWKVHRFFVNVTMKPTERLLEVRSATVAAAEPAAAH